MLCLGYLMIPDDDEHLGLPETDDQPAERLMAWERAVVLAIVILAVGGSGAAIAIAWLG